MVIFLSMIFVYDDYRVLDCFEIGLCYVMFLYYEIDGLFVMVIDLIGLSVESLVMDMIYFRY